jgi:hypothetical protein
MRDTHERGSEVKHPGMRKGMAYQYTAVQHENANHNRVNQRGKRGGGRIGTDELT